MIRHLQLHHPSLNLKRRSPIPLCEYHPVDPDTFSPPDGSQENFSNDATKVEDPLGTTPVPDTDMSTNSKFEDDGGGPSTRFGLEVFNFFYCLFQFDFLLNLKL